jgi:hypothetical protein
MAHKVIVPQKKIMSRSFLNSGTLIVILSLANRNKSNNYVLKSRLFLKGSGDGAQNYQECG